MSPIVALGADDPSAAEVDLLAAAVQEVVGVVALGGGGLLQPTTYLPGRLVAGIRSSAERVEVAVTAAFGLPTAVVADRIRAALALQARGRPIDVHIADLQVSATETSPALGPR